MAVPLKANVWGGAPAVPVVTERQGESKHADQFPERPQGKQTGSVLNAEVGPGPAWQALLSGSRHLVVWVLGLHIRPGIVHLTSPLTVVEPRGRGVFD